MKLNEMFTRSAVTAGPQETVAAVARRMQESNVGAVVIVTNRRPVGMVTDRDLALALGALGVSPQASVQKVMTHHVLAIPEYMGVNTALRFMREPEGLPLPVVDRENRLVGIVTLDDLLRFLGRDLHNLAVGIRHEMEVS
jgi:CBS domain-containing protein